MLTDSANPTDYIKKIKVRDKELSKGWGQIVTPLAYQTIEGTSRIDHIDQIDRGYEDIESRLNALGGLYPKRGIMIFFKLFFFSYVLSAFVLSFFCKKFAYINFFLYLCTRIPINRISVPEYPGFSLFSPQISA